MKYLVIFFFGFASTIASLTGQEAPATLKFEILDIQTEEPIPGKLVFLQRGKVVDLNLASNGTLATRSNTVYTATGKGEIQLAPGNYEIWVGRGVEYTADVHRIILPAKKKVKLRALLKRVVVTPGYVGADLHLHTLTHSGHGDSNMEERVVSCLAEGLEWLAATDHNHNTDYDTVMEGMGIHPQMLASVGNEVSTPIGHFNAYPLEAGTPPVKADFEDAKALFQEIRDKHSDSVVIQVNHPRYPDIDYFNLRHLDPFTGESADPLWSWDFDAFELLNENTGWGWDSRPENPLPVLRDWFNFLNSGRKLTAVGNSDSHSVIANVAGIPRNYVRSSSDDPAELDEWELSRNVKAGNVTVNRGLYVTVQTEDVHEEMGSLIKTTNGKIALEVKVQAPKWIHCDTVQVYANGSLIRTYVVDEDNHSVRFERTLYLQPQVDTWYVVVASGSEGMAPLVADNHGPVTPLGFTNPIWVDVDGDGAFSSLKDQAIQLVGEHRDDPAALLVSLKGRRPLWPFVLDRLRTEPFRGKIGLLSDLLPQVEGDQLTFLFQVLADYSPTSYEAEDLAKLDPNVQTIGMIKLQQGITYAEYDALRRAMGRREISDQLSQSFVLGPRPISGIRGDKAVQLNQLWVLPEDTLSWQLQQAIPDGQLHLHRSGSYVFAEVFASQAGRIDFLLNTDMNLNIWHNETLFQEALPAGHHILNLELAQGLNRFLFKAEASGDPASLRFQPIDYDHWLYDEGRLQMVQAHLAYRAPLSYTHPGSEKYTGGTENPLTDGLLGSADAYRDFWQGFDGVDMIATLDLGRLMTVSELSMGCLSNPGAWIFLPSSVSLEVSEDGENWSEAGQVNYELPENLSEKKREEFAIQPDKSQARYLRVTAKNQGVCPEWHAGAGNKAWLFVDEIVVK